MKGPYSEQLFFLVLFGLVGYLMWQIIAPFMGAVLLAAIIATVGHPLYAAIRTVMPRKNKSLAALLSVIVIMVTIFVPLVLLVYLVFVQAAGFYDGVNQNGMGVFGSSMKHATSVLNQQFPGFNFDVSDYIHQATSWVTSNVGAIFAGTTATILSTVVMFVSLFYLFKDGEWFTKEMIQLSPLPDEEDHEIIRSLGVAMRTVVLGTLAVALLQGIFASFGFMLFGVPHAVLWGAVAAIGALIPGVGTAATYLSVILFMYLSGSYGAALGLGIWATFTVAFIDNFIGPYLVSRRSDLHPLMVLLSALGGISLFGPVGFLVGPVILSFFMVLLRIYNRRQEKEYEHAR